MFTAKRSPQAMFFPPHYRRSVWWDVAAVVFGVALLLVPLGILATELMDGGGRGSGGGGVVASNPGSVAAPPQSGLSTWRARRSARSPAPGLGDGSPFGRAETNSPQSSVPFSSSWRERATPRLSGDAGASDTKQLFSGSAGASGGAPDAVGSGSISRGRSAREEEATRPSLGRGSERGWIAEARRLSGRARALSNQLGHMARKSEHTNSEGRQSGEARTGSSGAGAATQADNPSLPDEPTVPIDDHLHWLLVAGILWGAWRLWRGG